MQQPIKVGILGIKGLPAQAGVDRVVEAIVKRFPALGVFPTVFCDRSLTPESYSLNGATIVRVKSTSGKYLSAPTRFITSAFQALFSGDFDLIHLHNIEAGFILPLIRLKYPVVSTAHGFAYWRSKWGPIAKGIIRLTDWPFMTFSSAITSVSKKDAKGLSARYHKKVFYIPNGVGADFKPDIKEAGLLLASLGLSHKSYLIFVAGRIEPTKGAHLAIEAVNRFGHEIPLLVVGDIEQVPMYKKELQRNAGSRIHFLPFVKKPELLFGLIAEAKCLVFPSLVEAMPMVLLEAASLGCPILASDIEENRAILDDYIEYFKSDDVDSLVDRLNWVVENEACLVEKGRKAQEHIQKEYDWDVVAAKYVDIYQNIVRGENTI